MSSRTLLKNEFLDPGGLDYVGDFKMTQLQVRTRRAHFLSALVAHFCPVGVLSQKRRFGLRRVCVPNKCL